MVESIEEFIASMHVEPIKSHPAKPCKILAMMTISTYISVSGMDVVDLP
jgi:hypothetical protein